MGKLYQKRIEGGNTTEEKTYFNGAQAVAMRKNGTLYWLVGDHLGSTSLTASADGTLYSEIRYSAYGEVRFDNGVTPTKYQYTGQLSQMDEIGLYYYVARFYDPYLNHFIQADTIVPQPGISVAYDRYAYVQWNPIRYTDPSGHDVGRGGNSSMRDENYIRYPGWFFNNSYAIPKLRNGAALFTGLSSSNPANPGVQNEKYFNPTTQVFDDSWRTEPTASVHLWGVGKWIAENTDSSVHYYDYPGYDTTNQGTILGKVGQAKKAEELNSQYDSLSFIGFSAGGASALLGAYNAFQSNKNIDNVILLDPGFVTSIQYLNGSDIQLFEVTESDYKAMINKLTTNGINVTIVGSIGLDYSSYEESGATVQSYSGGHLDLNADVDLFASLWK